MRAIGQLHVFLPEMKRKNSSLNSCVYLLWSLLGISFLLHLWMFEFHLLPRLIKMPPFLVSVPSFPQFELSPCSLCSDSND